MRQALIGVMILILAACVNVKVKEPVLVPNKDGTLTVATDAAGNPLYTEQKMSQKTYRKKLGADSQKNTAAEARRVEVAKANAFGAMNCPTLSEEMLSIMTENAQEAYWEANRMCLQQQPVRYMYAMANEGFEEVRRAAGKPSDLTAVGEAEAIASVQIENSITQRWTRGFAAASVLGGAYFMGAALAAVSKNSGNTYGDISVNASNSKGGVDVSGAEGREAGGAVFTETEGHRSLTVNIGDDNVIAGGTGSSAVWGEKAFSFGTQGESNLDDWNRQTTTNAPTAPVLQDNDDVRTGLFR